jgi:hypothetical protein
MNSLGEKSQDPDGTSWGSYRCTRIRGGPTLFEGPQISKYLYRHSTDQKVSTKEIPK